MRTPGKCEACGRETSRTRVKRCRSCARSCAMRERHRSRPGVQVLVDDHLMPVVAKTNWRNHSQGYVFGSPNPGEKAWLLHHYVWFLEYGYVPKMLDHINRDKADNRLENLRLATRSLNTRNTADRFRESGLPRGVNGSRDGLKKPFQAWVRRHGRTHSLGYYATVEEAAEVARNAREIIEEFEIAEAEDLARAV